LSCCPYDCAPVARPRARGSLAALRPHPNTVSDESKGQDHHVEESEHQVFRLPPVALADRQWPSRTITHPPIWMSTDLRDGNQALFEPMNPARKLQMFRKLVAIGFKEIEVAFPSASQTDFDFVRKLIEENEVPDDVTIEVLSQSPRAPHPSHHGVPQGGPSRHRPYLQRHLAGVPRDGVRHEQGRGQGACRGQRDPRQAARRRAAGHRIHPRVQPGTFTATELAFAKEVCDAVVAAWDPQPGEKVIINLPSTVEVAGPMCLPTRSSG
jgi:2-isopropylmalate synthase